MSSHLPIRLWIKPVTRFGHPTLAAFLSLPLGWGSLLLTSAFPQPALAQYPTAQAANPDKNTQHLRAVAVLEWTGDQEHPKASRLVPVSIFDGNTLEDAGVYMAHPEPLALEGEVEYQLQQDGRPVGLFDVQSSGQQQGSWFGLGKWKPLPAPKAPAQVAKIDEDNDVQSDVPVLHRKHQGDSGADSGSTQGSGPSAAPSDPDRPTLHKGGDAAGNGSGGNSSNADSAPAPDPDRPTLHRSSDSSSSDTAANNSSQPKPKKNGGEDEGYVESVAKVTDPERPRIVRGKAEGYSGPVLPSVVGMPADMKQVVAVSDPKTQPVHPWDYSWANPDDEAKMQAAMEDIARAALGLNSSPVPAAKPTAKTTAARKTAKSVSPASAPAPLVDEQFRVFELAYGSGATMVLSARTAGADGPVRFVTLIAQPDLYGNVAVLVKNVTDAGRLDDTPRMRLVDAVDSMADNRGELLFELRGASQRQFALYRVLRGQATRIFVSGGEAIATAAGG